MNKLKRFLEPQPKPREVCEFCSEPLGSNHSHVVHLESRRIMCSCRACYLLFSGGGGGRYRSVPDRVRRLDGFRLNEATWDSLGIPVGMAFFFQNSALGRPLAFYPSPAGATQSLLDLVAWTDIVEDNPVLEEMEPDVEALLVRRLGEGFECFLVPVDACYELVGRIRLHWKGFDGGPKARQEIAGFFEGLKREPVSR